MYLTLLTLSASLLSQAAVEAPLVPVQSAEGRLSPADLVAQALALPDGATLTGQPLTLVKALSSAEDGRRQLEVAHAYWRLTLAVAEYRLRLEEYGQLGQIEARGEDALMFETARTSAAAALRMAQVAALSAQHELAGAALLPTSEPLPLPVDLPHVGTYRTYFNEVFSQRNPPARARLMDRNLPIHRRVIDVRASAVTAAQGALEATVDAYRVGNVDLADVLASLRRLGEQYRALLADVCNYNHDIADYALAVKGPQSDERVLVTMLIGPVAAAARRTASGEDSAEMSPSSASEPTAASPSEVQRATLNVPIPDAGGEEPTPAAGRGELQSLGEQTPTLAPPQESVEPGEAGKATPAAPSGESEGPAAEKDTQVAPSEEVQAVAPAVPEPPLVPVPDGALDPTPRTVNKPPIDDQATFRSAPGLYPALVDARPAVRAKLLASTLYWQRTLPEQPGESIELKQCLDGLSGNDRRQAIAAYWNAAKKAAEYQVRVEKVESLEQLVPIAMERRNERLGAEAMLDLHAARMAAQADLLRAHLDLVDAQFQLTRRVGRALNSPWLLPTTVPHTGPYKLKLEAQRRELVESWPLKRLATVIPALADVLEERASAVVQADTARASRAASYRTGAQPMASVLVSIDHQTEETLAFLETLTRYNEAIADYAIAVLPSTTSGEQLAKTLVVIR
ncbi:MAG: hypothetical protein ABIP48_14815 [Planctomycetota bacterium]